MAAQRAGISIGALRDLEQGRTTAPRRDSLAAIAQALGVDPSDFHVVDPVEVPAPPRFAISLLGPLTINSGLSPLRGAAQRSVLALLALHPNEYVDHDALIEALWQESMPPSGWQASLHSTVTKLRQALSATAGQPAISSSPRRYKLVIDEGCLDWRWFETAVVQASSQQDGPSACRRYSTAFQLWRGRVLQDVPELALHPKVARIEQMRDTAALAFADVAIASGLADVALPTVQLLCADQQLHERLAAKHVRLLAAVGRLDAAGNAYRAIRDRLAEELGVDPSAELQSAFNRVLIEREELPDLVDRLSLASLAPKQLPRPLDRLVGRQRESATLAARLGTDLGKTRRSRVILISGVGGIGKTSLAIWAAHGAAENFPDGQLFCPLDTDTNPARVLEQFLLALGHQSEALPAGLEELAALFRSTVADLRVLIVLDNAQTPQQVSPLLPGTANSAVLVTSRAQLSGLDAVDRVRLEPLSDDEALSMLGSSLGDLSVQLADGDARTLVRSCGGMPLAIRLTAARLTSDPTLTATEIATTAGQGVGPARGALWSSLDTTYRLLSAEDARSFRLLSVLPGSDVTVEAARHALDIVDPEQTLHRLADAGLLTPLGASRFGIHDVVREYAVERAERDEAPTSRTASENSVYQWLIDRTTQATRLNFPHRVGPREIPASAPQFTSASESAAWLQQERDRLVDAVARAERSGRLRVAWILADAATGAFRMRPHSQDWLAAARAGLSAATRLQDWQGIALSQESLARAHAARADHAAAVHHYRAGLEAAAVAKWPEIEVSLRENLGISLWAMAQLDEATAEINHTIALSQATGQRYFEASALNDLGNVNLTRGFNDLAIGFYQQAHTINLEIGDEGGQVVNLSNLALVEERRGDFAAARTLYEATLASPALATNPPWLIECLIELSRTNLQLGQVFNAASLAQEALDTLSLVDDLALTARALVASALTKAKLSGTAAALDDLGVALQTAWRAESPTAELEALLALAETSGPSHSGAEGSSWAAMAVAAAQQVGDVGAEAQALLICARNAAHQGDPDEARRCAIKAEDRYLAIHHSRGLDLVRIVLDSIGAEQTRSDGPLTGADMTG